MRRTTSLLALLLLFAGAGPAAAERCTIDAVPAATLLLPYFEVDYQNPDCINTLISINNASAAPTIAHVTLWTDESIPTLDFDLYLTGYDVQTLNLRDLFLGLLPVTADAQHDPQDTFSPHHTNPMWDGDFPGCGALPYTNPVLDAALLQHLRAAHTGAFSELYGGCLGARYGDGIARGYLTVDATRRCSTEFPDAPGYFVDGGAAPATATNDNVLWGDYFLVDAVENFVQGEDLVHIEAFDGVATSPPAVPPATHWVAGDYTFYGRYVAGSAIDNREPLGTSWASRYVLGGVFSGGTDLVVWRDSLRTAVPQTHACDAYFSWVALPQTQVVAFDEAEWATELCTRTGPPVSPPRANVFECFPWETGRYPVGATTQVPNAEPLATPYSFGWLYLNLDFNYAGSPFTDQSVSQSWVVTLMKASGRFSVGMDAIQLSSACDSPQPGALAFVP